MNVKQLIEVLKDLDGKMEIATVVHKHYAVQVEHVSILECGLIDGNKQYIAIGDQMFKNLNGRNGFISTDFYGKSINDCPFLTEI